MPRASTNPATRRPDTQRAMLPLPADRCMTDAERAGFRMACACFATWGAQLTGTSIRLAARGASGPGPRDLETLGRRIAWMAEALDLTLGRNG